MKDYTSIRRCVVLAGGRMNAGQAGCSNEGQELAFHAICRNKNRIE